MQSDTKTQRTTFDVLVKGNKKGEAFDVNPVVINTDSECKECLQKLKSELNLSAQHLTLIDNCIAVVSANDGDDVVFGISEIVELSQLSETYPSKVTEIMACSHHLTSSIDFEGDVPNEVFGLALSGHRDLAAAMMKALNFGSLTTDNVPDDDSITEESLTDEDE